MFLAESFTARIREGHAWNWIIEYLSRNIESKMREINNNQCKFNNQLRTPCVPASNHSGAFAMLLT
jgi:hypothetical protein